MDSLNSQQQKAVESTASRIAVVAAAGSGKTKVLTERIAHLINECSRDASALCALTFTNAAARETGGGQSTNIYAGGVYELEQDEALVVESRVKVPPQYIGFHLSNLWGESHDFANHQSSLNGMQMEIDQDGVLRWVVAHRDPGVPNWVDTTGHREGYLVSRWAYSKTPPKQDWPTVFAKKVPFAEIRKHLPEELREVTPDERRECIRERQLHIQSRYRVF